MTIRTIKDTDTFSSTFVYDPKTKHAAVSFSCRAKEGDPRHVLTCDIDYSTCSQAEIMELANRTVVIDLQRQWRVLAATKGSTARTVNPFAKVNVKTAVVDATRKSATPATKVMANLVKLSAKELADLEAQIAAMKKSASK